MRNNAAGRNKTYGSTDREVLILSGAETKNEGKYPASHPSRLQIGEAILLVGNSCHVVRKDDEGR